MRLCKIIRIVAGIGFALGLSLFDLAEAQAGPPLLDLTQRAAEASPFVLDVRRHFRRRRRARFDLRDGGEEKRGEREVGSAIKDAQSSPQANTPAAAAIPTVKSQQSPPTTSRDAVTQKQPESAGPPPPPSSWSEAEITAGRMDCDRRLSGLHAFFDRLDPIREGVCGSPSPIRLKGFDSAPFPALNLSPAPTISCKMTEAMARWVDAAVQPMAKAHLNAAIVQINTLSAYNCRSRYDDLSQRISQHALANAIDVGEFITAKGERISVLDNWNSGDERAAFLREIHKAACEIFGTTLGPEANEAHKNHFHLDMTERRRPLCDFTPAQLRAREETKKQPAVPVKTEASVPPSTPASKTPGAQPAPVPEPASKVAANTIPANNQKHLRRYRRRRFWLFGH